MHPAPDHQLSVSRMQLSRRLNDAGMQEKELNPISRTSLYSPYSLGIGSRFQPTLLQRFVPMSSR
jgi:hypothetical protein